MALIDWLPSPLPSQSVGGKASGLSDLARWGFDVPPGFVLRREAIEALQPGAPLPQHLVDELQLALERLGSGVLAVRSSGVSEDSAEHSFAGVHETVLGVQGFDALVAAVQRCHASADADRARAYRARREVESGGGAGLAIVVQRQLDAEVAGVAFSCDPVRGDRETVVVEAVAGLGEALVSGRATPARAVLARGGALIRLEAPPERESPLDEALARKVADAALQVEARAGTPVDVEWAVENGRLWLLQWRPVTTPLAPLAPLSGTGGRRMVWTNINTAELLPHVVRPLVYDLLLRYVGELLRPALAPFGLDAETLGVFGLRSGRVYFNLNAVLGWARTLPFARKQDLSQLTQGLGGDLQGVAEALKLLRPEDLPTHRLPRWRVLAGGTRVALALLRYQRADASGAVRALREETQALARVDPSRLDDRGLAELIERSSLNVCGPKCAQTLYSAAWGMIGAALLPALTRRWLDDAQGTLARRLLQGMGGLDSAAAGLALGRLGDEARRAGLTHLLEGDWPAVRSRLEATGAGQAFLARFRQFLDEHGHHARGETDVSLPRWSETPEYVLRQVRFSAEGAVPSPLAVESRERERAELVRALRGRLSPVRRWIFTFVVDRTARGVAARENNRSEAVRRLALTRRALLEAGRRLQARGTIAGPDDLWYLRWSELAEALLGEGEALAARIAERSRLYRRWEQERPPPVIVEGAALPAPPAAAPGSPVLAGVAASPGVVEGLARVVLHEDDEVGIRPGEVLVAPHTDPGWTPYFLHAVAVVTDFGGLLSHGAVIAREYGLPAVVNVHGATSRIRDGQRIRVDGDAGRVELLDP